MFEMITSEGSSRVRAIKASYICASSLSHHASSAQESVTRLSLSQDPVLAR